MAFHDEAGPDDLRRMELRLTASQAKIDRIRRDQLVIIVLCCAILAKLAGVF